MNSRALSLVSILALALALGTAGRAFACSCADQTEAESLEASTAAFEAVVIDVRTEEHPRTEPGMGRYSVHLQRARFRVTKWLKGAHPVDSIVRFQTMTDCC